MITDMTALESLPALFGARKKSEGKQATFLNINDHDNNEEEEEDVGGFKLSDLSGKSSDNDNDDDWIENELVTLLMCCRDLARIPQSV